VITPKALVLAYGGTEVPAFQNSDLWRDSFDGFHAEDCCDNDDYWDSGFARMTGRAGVWGVLS
jgi:hypothetical protein